jgi:hypothetical protein
VNVVANDAVPSSAPRSSSAAASCVSLCASTPPMTTVSVSCMLSIAVPSLRTGGPVGKGGHNSDEALVASRFL